MGSNRWEKKKEERERKDFKKVRSGSRNFEKSDVSECLTL